MKTYGGNRILTLALGAGDIRRKEASPRSY